MNTRRDTEQSGFALVMVITLLIPVMIAVAAFTSVMVTRSNELRAEKDEELALLTAEAGIDAAIYAGRIGALKDGVPIKRSFGTKRAFVVVPTYLKSDGKDNDVDGNVDESDEDVFQVISTGTHRGTTRRIASYLGPVPLLPTITSAMASMDPNVTISLKGTPRLSGLDMNIDGSAGPGPDTFGFEIGPPGTLAHLTSEITGGETTKVIGVGGATPNIGVRSTAIDVNVIAAIVKNIANIVLTSNTYASYKFGDASKGEANIIYRDGNVRFAGNSRGSGVMVVTGDLVMAGTFRFDGILIVLGKIQNAAGTADVRGAILQGTNGGLVDTKGTFRLDYSSQAIALANSIAGRYVAFNGWQELKRN